MQGFEGGQDHLLHFPIFDRASCQSPNPRPQGSFLDWFSVSSPLNREPLKPYSLMPFQAPENPEPACQCKMV